MKNNNTNNDRHKCPVCGKHEFDDYCSFDDCPICGWIDDAAQEANPDWTGCANPLSLNEAKAEYEKKTLSDRNINEIMRKASFNNKKVRVVDIDGISYEGVASSYTPGDDEEDGYSTVLIKDPKNPMCLGENEIRSIEVITP